MADKADSLGALSPTERGGPVIMSPTDMEVGSLPMARTRTVRSRSVRMPIGRRFWSTTTKCANLPTQHSAGGQLYGFLRCGEVNFTAKNSSDRRGILLIVLPARGLLTVF